MALVVFDLDGTISRHDTLIDYLTGFLRRHPRRWTRMLGSMPTLLGFVCGWRDHGQLKAALLQAALGGCTREAIDAWTTCYVQQLLRRGVFADALRAIQQHRNAADVIVLMSASPDLYVPQIARHLGFTESVCTGVLWRGEILDGALATPNCRGAEKARQFLALRARYPRLGTMAYANAVSDFEHLRLADTAWVVNPGAVLRRKAQREKFECITWR